MVVLQVLNSFLQIGMIDVNMPECPFPDPPTHDGATDKVNVFLMNLR
jgi:hypothetical protein